MSALWQRDYGNVASTTNIPRQLELRKIPIVTQEQHASEGGDTGPHYQGPVLQGLFGNLSTNWLYEATIQLTLNGSEPAWSSDGWSFVPVDVANVSESVLQSVGLSLETSGEALGPSSGTSITCETMAIRARIECSTYDAIVTKSSNWLSQYDLTNSSVWVPSLNPTNLETGYEIGCGLDNAMSDLTGAFGARGTFNLFPNASNGLGADDCGTTWYTGVFVNPRHPSCCVNITESGPGPASIGYWSANLGPQTLDLWDLSNQYNFSVKWITGSQLQLYYSNNLSFEAHLMWSEPPELAILNCAPIVETANARVTVDHATGRVIDFNITDIPQEDPSAWANNFEVDYISGSPYDEKIDVLTR